jgi:hypothetical protein
VIPSYVEKLTPTVATYIPYESSYYKKPTISSSLICPLSLLKICILNSHSAVELTLPQTLETDTENEVTARQYWDQSPWHGNCYNELGIAR